jgi:hypothetical protein
MIFWLIFEIAEIVLYGVRELHAAVAALHPLPG